MFYSAVFLYAVYQRRGALSFCVDFIFSIMVKKIMSNIIQIMEINIRYWYEIKIAHIILLLTLRLMIK